MTVSNAFNRPDQLSTELRERIMARAEELGFAGPDPLARGLPFDGERAVCRLCAHRMTGRRGKVLGVHAVGRPAQCLRAITHMADEARRAAHPDLGAVR